MGHFIFNENLDLELLLLVTYVSEFSKPSEYLTPEIQKILYTFSGFHTSDHMIRQTIQIPDILDHLTDIFVQFSPF